MEVSSQCGNGVCNCAGGKDYSVFFFCPLTSSCQKWSKWYCLRPTICSCQLFPHKRPASPQRGERCCGDTVFQEDQELNSRLSLVEGRSQRWQDRCCRHRIGGRRPTLVLQGRFIINTLLIIHLANRKMANLSLMKLQTTLDSSHLKCNQHLKQI